MKNNDYFYTSFALHKERDKELIDWLNEQPNKTSSLRNVIAGAMRNNQNEHAEMLEILRDLQSKQFVIAPTNGSVQKVEESEPQDISESLGSLGM